MRCVSPSVFKPSSSSFSALTSRADFTQAFWIFTPPSNMAYTSTTPWVFWESVNGSPIMSFLISPSGVLQGQYQPLQAQIYLYCLQYTLTEANTYSIPWSSWVHVTTRWYHSSKTFQTLINGQVVYAGQVTSDSSANSCQDSTSPVTDAVWNPQGLTYTQVALPGLMDELWQFKQALTDSQVQLLIGSNTAASCPAGSFSNADGLTCGPACPTGQISVDGSACTACTAGTVALITFNNGTVKTAGNSGGNVCGTCPISRTSYAQAADCNAPCAPTNFALGLQAASEHRVEVSMSSTSALTSYDQNSGVSDFTVAMWFYPSQLNLTQYLATKDGSWYVQLTAQNQLGVRLVPYMPAYFTTNLHGNLSLHRFNWHHAAVSVNHSFSYADDNDFSTAGVPVSASSQPTAAKANQQGYTYVRDQFSIAIYLDGLVVAANSFRWTSKGSASTYSFLTSSGYPAPTSVPVVQPVVSGQPINVGACMAKINDINTYLRYRVSSSPTSSQLPCATVPYLLGTWNGNTNTPSLYIDDVQLLQTATINLAQQVRVVASQYVINHLQGVTSYTTATVLQNSGAQTYLNQATSQQQSFFNLYPFLNPVSAQYLDFTNAGFFTGQVDEFAVFTTALAPRQVRLLSRQPIISPTAQVLDPLLTSAMTSLVALLQFEEWLSFSTGTIGSAALLSSLSSPLGVPDIIRAPLHINDGPLCYPASGASAGQQPSYGVPGQQTQFSPSASTSSLLSCPAGSSSWPGSIHCFLCPVGYTSSIGGVCQECGTNSYTTAPGATSCIAAPSGVTLAPVSVLDQQLQAQSAAVYGVYRMDILPDAAQVSATTTAVPGTGSPPPVVVPTVPTNPAVYIAPVPSLNLRGVLSATPNTLSAFAIANYSYSTAVTQSITLPQLNAVLTNGSYYVASDSINGGGSSRRLLETLPCILASYLGLGVAATGSGLAVYRVSQKDGSLDVYEWLSFGFSLSGSLAGRVCTDITNALERYRALPQEEVAAEEAEAGEVEMANQNVRNLDDPAERAQAEEAGEQEVEEVDDGVYRNVEEEVCARRRRRLLQSCGAENGEGGDSGEGGEGGEGGDGYGSAALAEMRHPHLRLCPFASLTIHACLCDCTAADLLEARPQVELGAEPLEQVGTCTLLAYYQDHMAQLSRCDSNLFLSCFVVVFFS